MTRDGEIPAIFNPKQHRVRTPSVVVTGDSPNGPYGGGFTNILNASNPQITHQDSISSSQQDPNEVITIHPDTSCPVALTRGGGGGGGSGLISGAVGGGGGPGGGGGGGGGNDSDTPTTEAGQNDNTTTRFPRLKACKETCCSELAQKMYFGVCVTILVTASWVGATHCIKFLYLNRSSYMTAIDDLDSLGIDDLDFVTDVHEGAELGIDSLLPLNDHTMSLEDVEDATKIFHIPPEPPVQANVFSAPFFAAWFFTNFSLLFFPIYVLGRISLRKCDKPGEILGDILRGFRDRGFTIGRFLNRCLSFCILWLLTTYLYTLSLRVLFATDAMALFATNVACVYLLSWVILHEQFVGVRIVAVILCDTGIALLAYMDGITESPTLSGVVLATLAAACYAVFRVLFHILMQFSSAVTYNMFVTLGLITAVPVSGALDVVLYGATFAGMKLAGVILIAVGFFLVMFPENWPDYITRLLRKSGRAILRYQCCCELAEIHYTHSKYHLIGSQREMGSRSSPRFVSRSASHHYRLSDGIHKVPSSVTLWPCEMTDLSPTGFIQNNHALSRQHSQQHHPPLVHQQSHHGTTAPPHSQILALHHQQYSSLSLSSSAGGGGGGGYTTTTTGSGGGGGSGHHGTSSSHSSSIRAPPVGSGGGRLFSYFGNDHEHERKKSETSFFNLGFRRKSTVVYYAATD
uniref:EamA domain-containing protein n=1 Tax=Stomoxys calcitrans TaxID=35570 RepID=A0A1I8Q7M8_STOCA